MVISSGTYSPASMIALTRAPNSVPGDVVTEHVTRGDVRDPEPLGHPAAWVPLPAPRRPDEQDPHADFRLPVFRE